MAATRSPAPAVGLDFGTTNSSIARIAADGSVELAQFPTPGSTTASFRSLLYFEQEASAKPQVRSFAGPSAIEHYLAPEDKHRRLVQSLKSYLPSRSLTGTEVFGRRYTVEDMLARILRDLRTGAEDAFGAPIDRALVGRPVRFVGAETEEDAQFAVARLADACHRAGFAEVQFEYEPVGAACAYEATLDHEELVLIGDFGGGTSDFSLLRVGPSMRDRDSRERVLGTSGVGLAGDAFDARLVRHLVSPALGAGSLERSGGKLLPAVPAWIYSNLERWHYLSFLRTRNVTEILKGAMARALEPEKIEALQLLIDEDLGFQLHGAVQRLKYQLSQQETAAFGFDEAGLHLHIPVERAQFESWIADDLVAIENAVDGLLTQTSTAPADIDRVFLTGGTSFVPAVERIFTSRFREGKVARGEAFTAVAHGLALRARQLF
ncbi:Hsp70 family protein [Acidipila sp. EB88]|uniref:Hsp70 family protein n=1 Tax=Acidipila sp. EB88 TaxID=2305226 RepID=UPI000F5F7C19|nr:Hsp70 family protein [Acidipila sp. EB88]RRA48131.1 Hsp70 family protein [Acidipila sp. EB88]